MLTKANSQPGQEMTKTYHTELTAEESTNLVVRINGTTVAINVQ